MLCPWRHSGSVWTTLWVTWSSCGCSLQGSWSRWPKSPFQLNSVILWKFGSIIIVAGTWIKKKKSPTFLGTITLCSRSYPGALQFVAVLHAQHWEDCAFSKSDKSVFAAKQGLPTGLQESKYICLIYFLIYLFARKSTVTKEMNASEGSPLYLKGA